MRDKTYLEVCKSKMILSAIFKQLNVGYLLLKVTSLNYLCIAQK